MYNNKYTRNAHINTTKRLFSFLVVLSMHDRQLHTGRATGARLEQDCDLVKFLRPKNVE